MSARLCTLSTVALFACLVASSALAQDAPLPPTAPPPANLAYVEGDVDLIHEGAADRAAIGTMLLDGDLVRTANGRAEIVFADGTLLHIDRDSELELLSPMRLRLRGGRVMVRVSAAATSQYTIDTLAASVRMDARGEYGLTADGRLARLEVTVARGIAEIDDGTSRTVVRGGEMASILGVGVRVSLQPFNSARWDAFERWAADRAYTSSTAISARQLPYELRPYGQVLDSYGRWDYVAPYGEVWFPSVAVGWRPYYTGAWSRSRYGWTWIGHDPWSWPTHHFGRWGFTGAAWYWIPSRVWGPAWVSWSFTPGYVSWCPLGWDGRAVVGYSYVSTWLRGGPRGDHPDYWPNYDPWRAWTVMPRDHFDRRRAVTSYAVEPARLPEETRRAMAGYAVPRDTVAAPLPEVERRAPAGSLDVAVPRSSVEPRRGAVRSPNAAPSDPPPASAFGRPDSAASYGPPTSSAPSAAPPLVRYPRAYDRRAGEAADSRRDESRSQDRADSPRVYTPPAYAIPRESSPRAESPRYRRPDRAEAPPPSSAARQRGDGPSGGRVRSPSAAPRDSGEGRAAPPPRQDSSEGQSQGGAVRRRPS